MGPKGSTSGSGVKAAAAGAGLGAGAMYLFDPVVGRRRRAVNRDRAIHLLHETNRGAEATQQDLSNRSKGLVAELRYRVTGGRGVDDRTIVERVRSEIGRVSRHTAAIDVQADSGRVILRGPILSDEAPLVVAAARAVPGVEVVEDRLGKHDSPDGIPALQPGDDQPRRELPVDILQQRWSPATRFLTGSAAGMAVTLGLTMRKPLGWLMALSGGAVLGRSLTNLPAKKLTGLGAGRSAIDVQKSMIVQAPVEQAYDLWKHTEDFPRFMSNVKEVRPLGDDRQHWVVRGPLGSEVHFDAVVSTDVPNEELAWRSAEGSTVGHTGRVRFEPEDDRATRVTVHLTYNPAVGAVGHAAAVLTRSDPETMLDEDLLRMKTLVETGTAPRDATAPNHGGTT